MQKQKIYMGCITLKGIHNDFMTRDVFDYKLLLKYNGNVIPLSSGIIKTNNSLYTDFKYRNEIRENGGQNFLFTLDPYSKKLELILFNLPAKKSLMNIVFNSHEDFSSYIFNFNICNEKQKFSFDYNLIEVDPVKFVFNSLRAKIPESYNLKLWIDSGNDNKVNLIYYSSEYPNVPIRIPKYVIIGDKLNDYVLKGEIFNQNESILQFKKQLLIGKSGNIKENYKKENSIINLSYSVST